MLLCARQHAHFFSKKIKEYLTSMHKIFIKMLKIVLVLVRIV